MGASNHMENIFYYNGRIDDIKELKTKSGIKMCIFLGTIKPVRRNAFHIRFVALGKIAELILIINWDDHSHPQLETVPSMNSFNGKLEFFVQKIKIEEEIYTEYEKDEMEFTNNQMDNIYTDGGIEWWKD